MIQCEPNSLFQLQTNLINTKVDMAVSMAIDRVVEQMRDLRHEMHTEIGGLRNEMNSQFATMTMHFNSLDKRVAVIESRLGIVDGKKKVIYGSVSTYFDKTIWWFSAAGFSWLLYNLSRFHIS